MQRKQNKLAIVKPNMCMLSHIPRLGKLAKKNILGVSTGGGTTTGAAGALIQCAITRTNTNELAINDLVHTKSANPWRNLAFLKKKWRKSGNWLSFFGFCMAIQSI